MFVHGGISEEGDYLNDCHLLNFHPIKWTKCVMKKGSNEEEKSPILSYHTCCLVLSDDLNNIKLNVYNIPFLKSGNKGSARVL